jgi:hypothetical protein
MTKGNGKVTARRIAWGSFEHQQREIYAKHIHRDGDVTYFGNGVHVMAVAKGRKIKPWVDVIGENGQNVWGDDFCYEDFFLPEELSTPSPESRP